MNTEASPTPAQWSPELPTKPGLWLFAQLITRPDFVQHYAHPRTYRIHKTSRGLVAQVNRDQTRQVSNLRGVWFKLPDLPRNVIEVQ